MIARVNTLTKEITFTAGKHPNALGDDLVQKLDFVMDRFTGNGVDLGESDIYIYYTNGKGDTYSHPIPKTVKTDDGNYITFTWNFAREVSEATGYARFSISAKKVEDDRFVSEWNSEIANLPVIKSIGSRDVKDFDGTTYEAVEDRLTAFGDEVDEKISYFLEESNEKFVEFTDIMDGKVADADEFSNISERYAKGTEDGTAVTSGIGYQDNSKYYMEQTEDMYHTSEAYAKGTVDGVDVSEGDIGYHDNAKYYKEQVEDSANQIEINKQNIASEIAARTANDAVMTARMDTFTNLPSGSTAGDAELIDIRVGARGETYTNAGSAVRDQVENINRAISERNYNLFINTSATTGVYWNSSGEQVSSTYWAITDYMPLSGETMYYDNLLDNGTNPCAIVVDGDKNFLYSFRPAISYGETKEVKVTFNAKYISFSISTDNLNTFKFYANPLLDIKTNTFDVNSATELIGAKKIKFINGYYIDVGTKANVLSDMQIPIKNDNWSYSIVSCSEGDRFTINADGGSAPRAYCFVDGSGDVLSRGGSSASYYSEIIEAPEGSEHLILSRYYSTTEDSYIGVDNIARNSDRIDRLEGEIKNYNIVSSENNNMAWSWWIYPQVVSFKRVRNMVYWGFTTSDGWKGIASYDIDSTEIKKNYLSKNNVDDHNALAVHVYDDGTVLVAYSTGHNEDRFVRVRRSTARESIDVFGNEVLLESQGSTCYAQIIYYNGITYLFYRSGTINWAYRVSDDNGVTWGNEVILITSPVQYYCMFRPTTTDGIIRVLMYSNPALGSDTDTAIRQAFLHLDTGVLYNSDNSTELGTSNISKNSITVIIPNEETLTRQRLMDCAVTEPSRPLILYAPFRMENDSQYKVYDGGTIVSIVGGGNDLAYTYQLGMCFVGNDVIVAAHGSGTDGGKDIIEVYSYSNYTVTSNSIKWDEIRGSIPIRNFRPIGDINGKCFLWQRGYYNYSQYNDFNTSSKIHIFE
jgi:hypothetical protein